MHIRRIMQWWGIKLWLEWNIHDCWGGSGDEKQRVRGGVTAASYIRPLPYSMDIRKHHVSIPPSRIHIRERRLTSSKIIRGFF